MSQTPLPGMHVEQDLAGYLERQVPHETDTAANEALAAFYAGTRALAKEHRIPDAVIVVRLNVKNSDGTVVPCMASIHHGSDLEEEGMLAWAFGRAQQRREERINSTVGVRLPRRKK